MPWLELSIVSQRLEFVSLFEQEGTDRRELCRRFGISPTTGYALVERYRRLGRAGLEDGSRRPLSSPWQTSSAMEGLILDARAQHPRWGGRKLRRWLENRGVIGVPSASTITAVLHRHGLIAPEESEKRQAYVRFERSVPNELWQTDFKGHFATAAGRCHPLTVLDDHSRYSLGIRALGDERWLTVKQAFTGLFRQYGLPDQLLMDNGAPWGSDETHRHTRLTVWWMELGIAISHGRPYHPQTQGKDERFHRTLLAEVIGRSAWRDLAQCQQAFDDWRTVYNHERPHQALALDTPASRYQPSRRPFPEHLEAFDYGPGAVRRRVDSTGWISFHNRPVKVGKPFTGHDVALRPAAGDGCFDILFHQFQIRHLDLAEPEESE